VGCGGTGEQGTMQLLGEDWAQGLREVAEGRFSRESLRIKEGCAITVVLAAEDYPEGAKKGVPIEIGSPRGTLIHAGTKCADGRWTTNGGRVMNLVAMAADLASARANVEADLSEVSWPGMQCRRDIGLRALTHAKAGKTVKDSW